MESEADLAIKCGSGAVVGTAVVGIAVVGTAVVGIAAVGIAACTRPHVGPPFCGGPCAACAAVVRCTKFGSNSLPLISRFVADVGLMTSRELISGFNLWSSPHGCDAFSHQIWFIFIQAGNIDIFLNSIWLPSAILYFVGALVGYHFYDESIWHVPSGGRTMYQIYLDYLI